MIERSFEQAAETAVADGDERMRELANLEGKERVALVASKNESHIL